MKFNSDRCKILNLGLKNCICTGYERCDLATVYVKILGDLVDHKFNMSQQCGVAYFFRQNNSRLY